MEESADPRQWLVAVCRQAREDAGMNRTVIAGKINRGEDVVRRFETLRGKWSPLTGQLVAAYADATGIPETDLWELAIRDWKQAQASPAEPLHTSERKEVETGSRGIDPARVRSGLKESAEPVPKAPRKKRTG